METMFTNIGPLLLLTRLYELEKARIEDDRFTAVSFGVGDLSPFDTHVNELELAYKRSMEWALKAIEQVPYNQ